MLIGDGLYVAMRVWTFAYFIPFVMEVEALDVAALTPAMREAAREWIALSVPRSALVVGAAVACWLAARRVDRLLPVSTA